jgi:hypothetical protein
MHDEGPLAAESDRDLIPYGDRGMLFFQLATASIALVAALVLALAR